MRLRWVLWPLVTFVVAFLGLLVYIKIEYTLVPDVLELLSDIERDNSVAYGELLFQTRGCSGCHAFGVHSQAAICPDLTGIASRRNLEDVRTSIVEPDLVIASGCSPAPCPKGLMPNYGDILNREQVEALLAFLDLAQQ